MNITKIFILAVCFSCFRSFGQVESKESPTQVIWRTIIQNIIDKNTDSLIKHVKFPLYGDWAGMAGLKEPSEKCSKNEFVKYFDKIFIKEIIDDLKSQTFKKINGPSAKDADKEYVISAGYFKIVGGFKDEEGMILRIKKIKGIYMLIMIQGVS